VHLTLDHAGWGNKKNKRFVEVFTPEVELEGIRRAKSFGKTREEWGVRGPKSAGGGDR